jgi:aspartate aminotransferase
MKLSARSRRIEPSATLSVSARAKEMRREGKPVLSFSAGEPDFVSPPSALRYAREAMERGETHYAPTPGIPELREAVAGYYRDRFGLEYPSGQVLVAPGAKTLLYEALQCLLDPGDEVLVFAPAWVSYVEQIRVAEGREVVVETSDTGFAPVIDRVLAACTPRTVGMIVNTPCNPTGAVFSADVLKDLAAIAERKDLWIIFDEIYERLVYDGAVHHNLVALAPQARERTLLVNGVSKAYAMTGWRIGYALGPKNWIDAMNALQGHLTSNACTPAQWAAVGAVREAEGEVRHMVEAFAERRRVMVEALRAMPGLSLHEPKGAFYAFVDVSATPIPDDGEFCRRLLEERYVAAVPGSAFLAPGRLRLSYANSLSEIEEGMARLRSFLESL